MCHFKVCDKLLDKDIKVARDVVKSQVGSISCDAAKAVVVDIAHNVGSSGLSQFVNFKAAI